LFVFVFVCLPANVYAHECMCAYVSPIMFDSVCVCLLYLCALVGVYASIHETQRFLSNSAKLLFRHDTYIKLTKVNRTVKKFRIRRLLLLHVSYCVMVLLVRQWVEPNPGAQLQVDGTLGHFPG